MRRVSDLESKASYLWVLEFQEVKRELLVVLRSCQEAPKQLGLILSQFFKPQLQR